MKKVVYSSIVALLLVVLGVESCFLFMKNDIPKDSSYINNSSSMSSDVSSEDEDNSVKINLNNDEIEDLLGMIPYLYATPVIDDVYKDAYDGSKVFNNSINKDILLASAYFNLEPLEFDELVDAPLIKVLGKGYDGIYACLYYKKDVVQRYIQDSFNISIDNLPNKVSIPGGTFFLQDDYYMVYFGAGSDAYYRKRFSYEVFEENKDIIIKEKVLFMTLDYDNCLPMDCEKYGVYKNTTDLHNNKNKIGVVVNGVDFNFDENYDLVWGNIIKYTPSEFKHVFKKGSRGYYWYSSEQI